MSVRTHNSQRLIRWIFKFFLRSSLFCYQALWLLLLRAASANISMALLSFCRSSMTSWKPPTATRELRLQPLVSTRTSQTQKKSKAKQKAKQWQKSRGLTSSEVLLVSFTMTQLNYSKLYLMVLDWLIDHLDGFWVILDAFYHFYVFVGECQLHSSTQKNQTLHFKLKQLQVMMHQRHQQRLSRRKAQTSTPHPYRRPHYRP